MWTCMATAMYAAKIEEKQINGVWYKLVTTLKTGEVISPMDGSKYSGTVNIPGFIKYNGDIYEIATISEAAFMDCDELVAVNMTDSITSIGKNAFYGCTKLESVRIPAGVEETGKASFKGCIGLKQLIIPVGVRYIGEETFYGCKGLEEIKLPYTIERIFPSAFKYCTGLISVILPNRVMVIDQSVFEGCSSLSSVVLPKVEILSGYLFSGCSSLKSIAIPNHVHTIANGVFKGCTSLEEVHITDLSAWCKIAITDDETSNPLYYARRLFLNGEEVKDLVIPEGITYVGGYKSCSSPFQYCSSITSVTFSSTVTQITRHAFYGCENLKEITIPETVTYYGVTPFEKSGITSIFIPASVKILENYAFADSKIPVTFADSKNINSVGSCAFENYELLKSIDLSGCSSIGYSAFENCVNLESVILSQELQTIGSSAFKGCINLKFFSIPNGVKSIARETFSDCTKLEKIIIPQSVTTIGEYAFKGCEQLSYVYVFAETPPEIGWTVFKNCGVEYSILYVPENSLENYKNTIWANFAKIIPLTEEEITNAPSMVNIPLSIYSYNGTFVIDGASTGTPITIYTFAGVRAGFEAVSEGTTTVYTNMQKGTAAVVKVGNKVIKTIVK